MKNTNPKIGIIGGVGPYAGLDLNKKIFDNTKYNKDQDHLEVILYSAGNKIADRTSYLLNPLTIENPALAAANIAENLAKLGVTLLAIPCNTFHSKAILNEFKKKLREKKLTHLEVVPLIENVFDSLKEENALPPFSTLGLLATKGTFNSRTYEEIAKEKNFKLLIPPPEEQDTIHEAIYHTDYGIKAKSNPVHPKAIQVMKASSLRLIDRGARGIILGCTEIPLALERVSLNALKIDPATLLARTLIRKVDPRKLKR